MADLNRYILLGYQDGKNRTPWANAPMTEEETREQYESPEQYAYWQGWQAAAMDRAMPILRAHSKAA